MALPQCDVPTDDAQRRLRRLRCRGHVKIYFRKGGELFRRKGKGTARRMLRVYMSTHVNDTAYGPFREIPAVTHTRRTGTRSLNLLLDLSIKKVAPRLIVTYFDFRGGPRPQIL